jgi:hypothetical protein
MSLDPHLRPLADVLVELVARELKRKNAVGPAKDSDGVKVQSDGKFTPDPVGRKPA